MNPHNTTFSPFTNRKQPGKFNSLTSTPMISPRSSSNLLFTPMRTPLRHPPSYSLSETPNSAQKTTNSPQNRQMRYANLAACTDGRSPGLHSRIVQYDNESRASLPVTHQTKYGSPGLFPVVHFFKKETPVITPKANKVTVRLASPDLHWYNKSSLLKRTISEASPDTRNGHHTPTLTAETETRSVLDALREISRKRIHTSSDFDNTPESSCKRRRGDGETYESNKRAREESPQSDSSTTVSPTQPQSKKICVVDLLAASYTSSQLLKDKIEKALKRKQDVDIETDLGIKEDEQQTRKQLKLTNSATQTSESERTIPEIKTSETPKILQLEEKQPEKKQLEDTPDLEVKQSNIFDTKKLEVQRKNKLAMLLGAITGEKPSLLPVEKTTQEEEKQTSDKPENKLVGILSPVNKPKHDKHVHFNLTPEVKSIDSLASENLSKEKASEPSTPPKSSPIVNFETPKAVPSIPKPKINISHAAMPQSVTVTSTLTSLVTSPVSKPESAPLSNLTFSFGTPKSDSTTTTASSTAGGFKFNLSPSKATPPTFELTTKNTTSNSSNSQMTSPIFSVANSSNSTKTTVTSVSNLSAISFGGDSTKNFGAFEGLSSASSITSSAVATPQSSKFGGLSTIASTPPISSTDLPIMPKPTTPNFGSVQFSSSPSLGGTPATPATTTFASGNFNLTTTASLSFGNTPAASTAPTFAFGSNASSVGFGGTTTTTTTKPSGFGATTTTTSSGFSFGGPSTGGFVAKTGFGTPTTLSSAQPTVPGFTSTFPGFGATANAPAFGTPTTASASGFGAAKTAPAFGTPTTSATGFGTNTSGFGSPATTTTGFGTNTPGFGAPVTTASGFGANTNTPAFGTPSTTTVGFGTSTNNPGFGVTTTTASGFGTSAFGPPTTNATGFGTATNTSAFGTSAASGTGFGAVTTTASGFGTGNGFGAATAPKFGGGPFGATTTASGFSSSGFGSTTTTASSFGTTTTTASGFGFGTPTTTAPTFTGFGGPTNTFTGAKPTTQSTTGFGNSGSAGFGAPNFSSGQTGQSIFGANQNNQNSTFPAATTAAPAFGTNTSTNKPFNFGAANATAPSTNFNTPGASGGFGFGTPASTTSSSSVFNTAKPNFGSAFGGASTATTTASGVFGSTSAGFGGSFGNSNFSANNTTNQSSSFGNATNTFGAANTSFGGNANSTFTAPTFGGGFGNGDAPTTFSKPQVAGSSFVAGSGDSTFQFGQNNTSAFGATNPTGNTAVGGPVFAFGGGPNPSTTTAPTGGVFAFGNADAKPNVNFGGQSGGFGATPNFAGAAATPQFGAPSIGVFSVGSSGSNAAPRQRHQLKAKRRT